MAETRDACMGLRVHAEHGDCMLAAGRRTVSRAMVRDGGGGSDDSEQTGCGRVCVFRDLSPSRSSCASSSLQAGGGAAASSVLSILPSDCSVHPLSRLSSSSVVAESVYHLCHRSGRLRMRRSSR